MFEWVDLKIVILAVAHGVANIVGTDCFHSIEMLGQTGDLKEAMNFFDTAMKLDPENSIAIKGYEKTNNLINNNVTTDV